MKGADSNFAYTSTLNAFVTITRKEGYFGLYKGMVPNVVKVMITKMKGRFRYLLNYNN